MKGWIQVARLQRSGTVRQGRMPPQHSQHLLQYHRRHARISRSLCRVLKPAEEFTADDSELKSFDELKEHASIPSAVLQDDARMKDIYDKVIALCKSRNRDDWKKLITLSTKWSKLANGVFDRIHDKGREAEDPEEKLEWLQFGRSLFNVHKEIERYDALIARLMATNRLEWETIIADKRADMTPEFFAHLQQLIIAGENEPDKQDQFKIMASALISMVEMYDEAISDKRSLAYAKDAIHDILEVQSVDEADHRIDELAANGGLDGAFLLTMAKMYMSVKESPYTKEETKDVMYHLYVKAKESASDMLPAEVRILKHLLSIEDPLVLKQSIFDAFTAGEVASTSLDYLSTTPPKLLKVIDTVLRTYETHKGKHSALGATSSMMNPEVIQRMRKLEAYIKKEFL